MFNSAYLVYASEDCGNTWQFETAVGETGEDFPVTGDRPEVYVDPFNVPDTVHNVTYLSFQTDRLSSQTGRPAETIPATGARGLALFRSLDGGRTWTNLNRANGTILSGRETHQWTSTPRTPQRPFGRLFLARCVGTTPQNRWSDDRGATWSGPVAAFYTEGGVDSVCDDVDQVALAGDNRNVSFPSVSRAPTSLADTVRLAYPALVNDSVGNTQVARVVSVNVGREGSPGNYTAPVVSVNNNITISGASDGMNVIWGNFIESDRFEYQVENELALTSATKDLAVFTWTEVPLVATGLDTIQHRYRSVARASNWDSAQTASVLDGMAAPWTYQTSRFVGDYDYGSFYYDPAGQDGELQFFIHWAQSVDGITTNNAALYYNAVAYAEDAQ